MGELLLCADKVATKPFKWHGVIEKIYSLEELSYLLKKNTFLIDDNLISEELCDWIEEETCNKELANKLRMCLQKDERKSVFVMVLLQEVGYLTPKERDNVLQLMREMETKPKFEVDKLKADQLLKNGKFISSIKEYKQLLASELEDVNSTKIGNIWHNIGTAYARLYQFDDARENFLKAYALNANELSLEMALLTTLCEKNEKKFNELAEEYDVDIVKVNKMKRAYENYSFNNDTVNYMEKTHSLEILRKNDYRQYEKDTNEIIIELKEEYRKLCSE